MGKTKHYVNIVRRKIMHGLTQNIGIPFQIKKGFHLNNGKNEVRVLIVRPNSRLGNQLMITPLLQEIEAVFPNAKIDLFVRGNLAPILFKNYKSIDRIIKLPPKPFKELGKYIQTWYHLRKYTYDIVFNVDAASSSGRLCTKWVRGNVKFFGDNKPQGLYSDESHMAKWPVYNFQALLHEINYSFSPEPPHPLSLHLNEDEIKHGKQLLKSLVGNDKPTIMFYTFATGSKCLSKEWWKPFFSELKEKYGDTYNLLEVLPKENVSQIDFESLNYYSTDIREMGSVMHHGSVFITGDCGVMHLASSVDVPVIALFSAENIECYKPYNPGSKAFLVNKISNAQVFKALGDSISQVD